MKGQVIIPKENKEALFYAIKAANEVRPVKMIHEEPYSIEKNIYEIFFTDAMSAFYAGRIYEKILMESQIKHEKEE